MQVKTVETPDVSASTWASARFCDNRSSRGFYESWFIRANHPSRPHAFWIRYTVFEPGDPDQAPEGELWACYFDGEAGQVVQTTNRIPLSQCFFATDELRVIVGNASLGLHQAKGVGETGKSQISWHLDMQGGQSPLLMLPEKMYGGRLPKAKSLVLSPNSVFDGHMHVNGETIDVTNWRGSINHNWGSRHTDEYQWGQVAGFDNETDAFLEVATATLTVGKLLAFDLTPLVLRYDGREYAFNSVKNSFFAKGAYERGGWSFETANKYLRVRGEIRAPKDQFAAFHYRNPPGGEKLCLNTKIARCDLWLDFKSGEKKHLVSTTGTAWEILRDTSAARR